MTDVFDDILAHARYERLELPEDMENKFQDEFFSSPWAKAFSRRHGKPPLLEGDYDYRRAWQDKALDLNDPNAHGLSVSPESGIWLKDPLAHPTSWMEVFAGTGLGDPERMSRPAAARVMKEFRLGGDAGIR